MMVMPLSKGTLHITDEVIAIITEAAVNETDGITGTISGFRDEFARVVSKNPARGVAVSTDKGAAVIDAKVSVAHGSNISEICYKLQEKVKSEVEMMTGFEVQTINIYVEQINF